MLNGWLILDKPGGISSAQAVARVKGLLNPVSRVAVAQDLLPLSRDPAQRLRRSQDKIKIGHAGTLDPLASGVLPLALGEATKTVQYMMDADKAYSFTVTWGEERDTDDVEGKVIHTSDKRPTQQDIMDILPGFIGTIRQTPPIYSAIKVDGDRAYALARSGEAVELKAREVRVDSLQSRGAVFAQAKTVSTGSHAAGDPALPLCGPQDYNTFLCHCGKGTYIRSLARDMGRKLGCYGHISALRRLKVGKFDETQAISLAKLEEIGHKGALGFLQPVTSALDDILAVHVTPAQATGIARGQSVVLPLPADTSMIQARCNGKLIAICETRGGVAKPMRVFNL